MRSYEPWRVPLDRPGGIGPGAGASLRSAPATRPPMSRRHPGGGARGCASTAVRKLHLPENGPAAVFVESRPVSWRQTDNRGFYDLFPRSLLTNALTMKPTEDGKPRMTRFIPRNAPLAISVQMLETLHKKWHLVPLFRSPWASSSQWILRRKYRLNKHYRLEVSSAWPLEITRGPGPPKSATFSTRHCSRFSTPLSFLFPASAS